MQKEDKERERERVDGARYSCAGGDTSLSYLRIRPKWKRECLSLSPATPGYKSSRIYRIRENTTLGAHTCRVGLIEHVSVSGSMSDGEFYCA